jgi:hypothetical protein
VFFFVVFLHGICHASWFCGWYFSLNFREIIATITYSNIAFASFSLSSPLITFICMLVRPIIYTSFVSIYSLFYYVCIFVLNFGLGIFNWPVFQGINWIISCLICIINLIYYSLIILSVYAVDLIYKLYFSGAIFCLVVIFLFLWNHSLYWCFACFGQ